VADSDPPPFLFLSLSLSPSPSSLLHTSRVRNIPTNQRGQLPLVINSPRPSLQLTEPQPRRSLTRAAPALATCQMPIPLVSAPRTGNVACRHWSWANRARSTSVPVRGSLILITLGVNARPGTCPREGGRHSSCGAADEDARRSSSQLRGWIRRRRGGLSSPRREERTTNWRSKV